MNLTMNLRTWLCVLTLCSSSRAFQTPSLSRRSTTTKLFQSTRLGVDAVETSVDQLKRTLEREYASFFSPMERDFYAPEVTFDDPMNDLEGVDAYQGNVDMLSGKNIVGKILFRDAGIVLHNIEGGEVNADGSINDIITRWTLRLTFQALPWQPTTRFSGISVYNVKAGGPRGVQVMKQTDFWDSINIVKGGTYQKVPKGTAISHFLEQLKPSQFAAPSAGKELPYQLLRKGLDYEVRRYPAFNAVETTYERRDEGFSELGSFCSSLDPLSPALFSIVPSEPKAMMWPLGFAPPGSNTPPEIPAALEKLKNPLYRDCQLVTFPERVVAIGSYSDASMEPVVRKADRLLREACERDGLTVPDSTKDCLTFAQYDAIYSMGKRRGEVWIELEDHPWINKL